MERYVPYEKRSEAEIQAEIDQCFNRWNEIHENGCQDPFWEDGVNLNLVRNHIIYFRRILSDKQESRQLSLFDSLKEDTRPLPPMVPSDYMAPNGKYPNRLHGRRAEA